MGLAVEWTITATGIFVVHGKSVPVERVGVTLISTVCSAVARILRLLQLIVVQMGDFSRSAAPVITHIELPPVECRWTPRSYCHRCELLCSFQAGPLVT